MKEVIHTRQCCMRREASAVQRGGSEECQCCAVLTTGKRAAGAKMGSDVHTQHAVGWDERLGPAFKVRSTRRRPAVDVIYWHTICQLCLFAVPAGPSLCEGGRGVVAQALFRGRPLCRGPPLVAFSSQNRDSRNALQRRHPIPGLAGVCSSRKHPSRRSGMMKMGSTSRGQQE